MASASETFVIFRPPLSCTVYRLLAFFEHAHANFSRPFTQRGQESTSPRVRLLPQRQ